MQESQEQKCLKKGKNVDNFFHNLLHEQIAIEVDKMYEISQIINARSKSTNVTFFNFIALFADKIDELAEIEEQIEHCSSHNEKQLTQELEMCNIKVSLCISVLVNFFYPIIEQLEKIVEEGIKLEKDLK